MVKTIVDFGYNTDRSDSDFRGNTEIGTKYNFNVAGEVLGIFFEGDQKILLTQITKSFGDDCMKGTIDAREVEFEQTEETPSTLLSNNELSPKNMAISKMLSSIAETKNELESGMPIEETTAFKRLLKLGINLDRVYIKLAEKVSVTGIEPEHFKKVQLTSNKKIR